MIDNKAQIRELALTVVDGLHKYIHVHNRIYKDSATFKSVVKNLFGFGVPMSELLENAETLIPLWDSIQIKLENYKSVAYANLAQDEVFANIFKENTAWANDFYTEKSNLNS